MSFFINAKKMYAKFEDEVKEKLYEIKDNIKLTIENITIEHVIYLIEYAMDFEDFQIWLTKQYSLGKILSDNDIYKEFLTTYSFEDILNRINGNNKMIKTNRQKNW